MSYMVRLGVGRGIVLLSLVLMLSGFLSYYVMSSEATGQTWVLQDLSVSAGSHSSGTIVSGIDIGIGTLVILNGDLTHSIAGSSILAVSATTVVVEKRHERTSSLRDRIIEEIDNEPGIHLRELQRAVGCAMGAVQYHLRVLESQGLIMSLKSGNSRHFFMADFSSDNQLLLVAAALRNPTVAAIVEQCKASGRVTQADLSRSLDLDKSLVSYYTGGLVEMGLLRTIRTFGRERPVMLTEWASSVLQSLGV